MPQTLICPLGHTWESPTGASLPTLAGPIACPHCGGAGRFTDTVAPDSKGPTFTNESPTGPRPLPEHFGRYRILKQLGKGGMGAVYLAHDTQLGRSVALKVPSFTAGQSSSLLQRFYQEARSAATLVHPNICAVYDVGEIDGTHFLTMAFIEGRPLSDTASTGMEPAEAAALVRRLALALQAAHAKGIIHRDLKPANIMIDPHGEPIVMDFGLARRVDDNANLTSPGAILGTPSYMPPEQANGDADQIGPGCDIYSLGVILYQLLTGKLPYTGKSAIEILTRLVTTEPPPPSSHRPDLDPALEAICLQAMAKKVEDRFASMSDFAAVLEEYLQATAPSALMTSQARSGPVPISARRSGPVPVAARRSGPVPTRREPSGTQVDVERVAAPRARLSTPLRILVGLAFTSVVAAGAVLYVVFSGDNPSAGPAGPTTPTVAVASQPRPSQSVATLPTTEPKDDPPPKDPGPTPVPKDAVVLFDGKELGGWQSRDGTPPGWTVENGYVEIVPGKGDIQTKTALGDGQYFVEFWLPPQPIPRKGFMRDNSGVFLQDRYEVQIADSTQLETPGLHACGALNGVIAPTTNACKKPRYWQTLDITFKAPRLDVAGKVKEKGRITVVLNGAKIIEDGAFDRTADGPIEATAQPRGPLRLQNHGMKVRFRNIWFRPAPDAIPKPVIVKEQRRLEGHTGMVHAVVYAPNNRHLLTGGSDRTVRLWDTVTGKEMLMIETGTGGAHAVAFTPDGKRFLVGTGFAKGSKKEGYAVEVWDIAGGKEIHHLLGHNRQVLAVAVSPDGKQAVTGSFDGQIRLWDLENGKSIRTIGNLTQTVRAVVILPDGKQAISGGSDSILHLWDLETGNEVRKFEGHGTAINALMLSGKGEVLSGSTDGTARLWDIASGKELRRFEGHTGAVHGVAFLPQPGRILTGSSDSSLRVWDIDSGRELARLEGNFRFVLGVAVCGNGCHAVSVAQDAPIRMWDLRTIPGAVVKMRNPFEVPRDVPKPDDGDVKNYAAGWSLKGKSDDVNAKPWVTEKGEGSADSLDGTWQMRRALSKPKMGLGPWTAGTAHVKIIGDQVFIYYTDATGEWLIEAKQDGQKLIGRYLNLRDPKDALPWVGLVVDGERIDGQWSGGRWDLRRKLK